jgi:hypothetical protein
MSVSIGCLTRVYLGEIPYIRSFLNHGLNIGIDTFYLVVPSREGIDRIENILREYQEVCAVIFEEQGRNPNHALRIDVSRVKTDYLMSIDVDEFLYLEGARSIKDFLEDRRGDAFTMKWIMAPRDFDQPTGLISGFRGHAGKKLAPTNIISGIEGPHEFQYWGRVQLHRDSRLKLVHYWGRGFRDVVIKCAYQNLPGRKRSSIQDMENLLKTRKLPERLKVLASLTRHAHDTTLDHQNQDLVDEELEAELLSVVSASFLGELEDVYRDYKLGLDYENHVAAYPDRVGNIYDLGRNLP